MKDKTVRHDGHSGTVPDSVAIVAMGAVFPGGGGLDGFWDIVQRGVDTSRAVPPGRWILDPARIHHPTPGTPDSVYTDRGCFIDSTSFQMAGLNLPASWLPGLDPSARLLLEAGRMAMSRFQSATIDRARIGVMVGNIALPTQAASALNEEILESLRHGKIDAKSLWPRALNHFSTGLPAGLLARALNLGGGACALDAACASSLYALKLACDELQSGRADAMLAGGLSRPDSLYTQMGFCQLHALSRSGRCAPFDASASGLLVGEGAGVVVLKRLADAVRDGDAIHAVIRGIGLSNDLDGNLLSPSTEGQLRALRQACKQAGWQPNEVDFIECHATGTPVGDAVEFESLRQFWGGGGWKAGQCVLGAVKANIGHLLTGAGAASLIKTLLALKRDFLPPTANFTRPSAKIPLDQSPFSVLTEGREWKRRAPGVPRRAAINGFGFGGINAHVLIEEWLGDESVSVKRVTSAPRPKPDVAIVGMAASAGPWRGLKAFEQRVLGAGGDGARVRGNWRGLDASALFDKTGFQFPGFYQPDLDIPMDRYRIPPKELAELLPQQALMLESAREALQDAGGKPLEPAQTGVFIGLGLDARTTDFYSRWAALAVAGSAGESTGNPPPLTADRTLGSLAGVCASRIAKEFHFGGPSHTVCAGDDSGMRALEIAVRALQSGALDRAIAGAVELTGDVRSLLASDALHPWSREGQARPFDRQADGPIPGEGAVALVLKRLEDARRDGDRVYAVVRGIGTASGADDARSVRLALERAYRDAGVDPSSVGFVEAHGAAQSADDSAEALALDEFFHSDARKFRCRVGSVAADVGHAGAASGLMALAKAALAVSEEILPGLRGLREPIAELAQSRALLAPVAPQYWALDRADGPRRAGVSCSNFEGGWTHVVLEESGLETGLLRSQPVVPVEETLFVLGAENPAELESTLSRLSIEVNQDSLAVCARKCWLDWRGKSWRHSLALIAGDAVQFKRLAAQAAGLLRQGESGSVPTAGTDRDRLFYTSPETRLTGGIAFVFPGAGNCFPEMGRELLAHWPGVARAQDGENRFLASQMCVEKFWNAPSNGGAGTDHRAVICGQVTLGTLMSDLARSFGIQPEASIGYSLGESTGLFALRAWKDRDEMLRRVSASTLFASDLTGTAMQLRRAWKLPPDAPVEWVAGLVDCSADAVRAAIGERSRVYVLIINTPGECVIGGDAAEVRDVVGSLGCHWFALDGVSTVHCDLLRPFVKPYRELHLFDTTPPTGIRFYSGGWGRAYTPDRETAADAIVAQAGGCIDFPRVIRAAHESGLRFFVEIGPGNSCSRMIGQILEGRPHAARSICASAQEPVPGLLRLLGSLAAEGIAVDLTQLFPEPAPVAVSTSRRVRIAMDGSMLFPSAKPNPPALSRLEPASAKPGRTPLAPGVIDSFEAELLQRMTEAQSATLQAHQAYLDFSQRLFESLSGTVQSQMTLLTGAEPLEAIPSPALPLPRSVALDRAACLEFARGSVASVLGAEFARVDSFPTRVRLPDEPLMLVDRIIEIHAEARSMTHGNVVTEHDIHPGAWYLDCGRIPTCIAVEAGQADLFLSGYLGIDFLTEGRAVYRLLDAKVRFHRGLPGPGEVIRYDIYIDHFFNQGSTRLFRFHFEATVDGQPVLTMTDGCAGFFSAGELAGGKGVVRTAMDLRAMPGKRPADWETLTPMAVESYSQIQLDALRAGDLAACFGPGFAGLRVNKPITIPSGRMNLVHRISRLEPEGGRFGIGLIRGEADIHPKDWFLTCHFVDDRVMPGTLMFECCLHTLRVFLLRMGWVAEQGAAVLEPMPGVFSQLKCRGQVLETTRTVTYEVTIKELGYGPEPYVLADALMYADGKPIVEIGNMSLRYGGATREQMSAVWAGKSIVTNIQFPGVKPAVYDSRQIMAYAVGNPSEGFGEPYHIFDTERRIARLPGPPYLFLDRITEVRGEPFKMAAGAAAEGQYDVPVDAWYFGANRQSDMPFAVLLEIALQPCGWLAAYVGSALTSPIDISFRNLGGKGRQLIPVFADIGTLTIRVKLTRVSSSAGMIIQWFDMEVLSSRGVVYTGDTYFGFFPKAALARQEGIREAALYQPSPAELAAARSLDYPGIPPFADTMLRMIDRIEVFVPQGGPKGLGFIRGTKCVEPGEWFFKAHFYQDPVVPGSLGLESMLQLLKFVAIQRWGTSPGERWEAVAVPEPHEWVYRGQIIPTDQQVSVEACVTAVDDDQKLLTADGFLSVDGRVIYGMKHFTVRARRD